LSLSLAPIYRKCHLVSGLWGSSPRAPRGARTRTGHRQINHRVNATQTDMTGPTYQPVKWKGGKWKGNQPDAHATAGSPK